MARDLTNKLKDRREKRKEENFAAMRDMIENPEKCYGCGACAGACPYGALSMRPDETGFIRPAVDTAKCVGCGRCQKACPRLSPAYRNDRPERCSAVMAEDGIRRASSSGGAFTVLAEAVLDAGGCVFGAAMDDGLAVRHIRVDDAAFLDRLRGSKYVQSDTGGTYGEAKRLLDSGRTVLYTGTPCQIAGLNGFLGRGYDNLLTVDILCSGVPPQGVLPGYAERLSGGATVSGMSFRDTDGWAYRVSVLLEDGTAANDANGDYMRAYLSHNMNNPACASCQFACLPRQGDVTIGDFWAISKFDPLMNDGLGTSFVLLNNAKARKFWEGIAGKRIKAEKQFPLDAAILANNARIQNGPTAGRASAAFLESYRTAGGARGVLGAAYHYDVGIAGTWLGNFGTISTNWALYSLLRQFGLSACFLDVTGNSQLDGHTGISDRFAVSKGLPRASRFCSTGDYGALNHHFDMFATASDQLWCNFTVYIDNEQYVHLGFADDGKRLVAAGTSIGVPRLPYGPDTLARRKEWLSRFSDIGVRDDFAPGVLRGAYGVNAVHIQDPVFLCDPALFLDEADGSPVGFDGPAVFAYLLYVRLDGPEAKAALRLAGSLGCSCVLSFGPGSPIREYAPDGTLAREVKPLYKTWLRCFKDARFVVTNSFHGACMSLVFEDDFAVLPGNGRERFECLARDFGCGSRILQRIDDDALLRLAQDGMRWSMVSHTVAAERERGRKFLERAFRKGRPEALVRVPKRLVGQVRALPGTVSVRDVDRFILSRCGDKARFYDFVSRARDTAGDCAYLAWLAATREPDMDSLIAVEIPAYNDPELQNTIRAMLAMAANPDRLRFSVCLQGGDADDEAFLNLSTQCRYVKYAAANSPGTCWARADCQGMYDGEQFVLRIDSHMRFAHGWDVASIRVWHECNDPMAIVTGYPLGYEDDILEPVWSGKFDTRAAFGPRIMNALHFENISPRLRFHIGHVVRDSLVPVRGAFVAGGMCFLTGKASMDVLFDRDMLFIGDECPMSARYFTKGYNVYHSHVNFIYHLYYRITAMEKAFGISNKRLPTVGKKKGMPAYQCELERLNELYQIVAPDRHHLVPGSPRGLGTVRTFDEFEAFSGVSFKDLSFRKFSHDGRYDVPHTTEEMAFFDWFAIDAKKGSLEFCGEARFAADLAVMRRLEDYSRMSGMPVDLIVKEYLDRKP